MPKAVLRASDLISHITQWLHGGLSSAAFSQWANQCMERWEEDDLVFEDEDLFIQLLYKMRFADWLDSVPAEKRNDEPDCSFSKKEAAALLQQLRS